MNNNIMTMILHVDLSENSIKEDESLLKLPSRAGCANNCLVH